MLGPFCAHAPKAATTAIAARALRTAAECIRIATRPLARGATVRGAAPPIPTPLGMDAPCAGGVSPVSDTKTDANRVFCAARLLDRCSPMARTSLILLAVVLVVAAACSAKGAEQSGLRDPGPQTRTPTFSSDGGGETARESRDAGEPI